MMTTLATAAAGLPPVGAAVKTMQEEKHYCTMCSTVTE